MKTVGKQLETATKAITTHLIIVHTFRTFDVWPVDSTFFEGWMVFFAYIGG